MMVISMAQNVYMLSMAFLVPLRRLSTSKYEVYSKSVPSSMWGVDTLVIMQYLRIIKNILHGTMVVVLIKENVIMR